MSDKMPNDVGAEIIPSLTIIPFKLHPPEDKVQILRRGRPKCVLSPSGKDTAKSVRPFNIAWYDVHPWLCGSSQLNKLFCWPCLLMRPETSSWCSTGVDDIKKLMTHAAKHVTCKSHLKAIKEYDGTMIEIGMAPEYSAETTKMECGDSDSGSDLGKSSPSKRAVNTADTTNNNGSARQTLTFQSWQQSNVAKIDPKLARRRRRLARIEILNAELTTKKLRLEIQLLESKLELQHALQASVNHQESGQRDAT